MGDRLGEKVWNGLSSNQQRIIVEMDQNPNISIAQLAEVLSISTTAIENNIVKLKKAGIAKRIGGAKGGHWEIAGT